MTSLLPFALSITASAYGDVYYAYSTDRPEDHELPPYLFNHTRAEEVNLNLGILKLEASDERVRGALALPPQVVARGRVGSSTWLYGRLEHYADPQNVIVSAVAPEPFRQWTGTIGVDMPVTSYATWRLESRQFFSDVSDDFLVVTTGLAIRFGGGLK